MNLTQKPRSPKPFPWLLGEDKLNQMQPDGSWTYGTAAPEQDDFYKDGHSQNTVYLKDWRTGQFGIELNGEETTPDVSQTVLQIHPRLVWVQSDNSAANAVMY